MPKSYMAWKKNLRALMAEWWSVPPLENVPAIRLTFFGPARGDLDNLMGAVLDSGNGVIWIDDRVSVIEAIEGRFVKAKKSDSAIHLCMKWNRP